MQIYLKGKPYRIEVQSYRAQDVTNFAPRATTPGGGIVYSELGLYQPLFQGSWHHGFGFPWHEEAAGYMRTEGSVDTRHPGIAMLMTKYVGADTAHTAAAVGAVNGFIGYQDNWYWFGAGGSTDYMSVRKLSTDLSTFVNVWPNSTDNVLSMWQNGKYLFAALDKDTGGGLYYTSNPSTAAFSTDQTAGWAQTGLSTDTSVDYRWITHHDGYVYAGKQRSTDFEGGHEVYYDDNVDLSQIAGTSTDDPNMIPVGLQGGAVIGAQSFNGDLLFMREDAVYKLDKDKNAARIVLDFKDQAHSSNFRSWAIHNGYLVFAVRDTVYQWNGLRLTDITPPPLQDVYPFASYGAFDNFVTVGKYLYCTAYPSDTDFSEADAVLTYDGVGWHKPSLAGEDGGSVDSMAYDPQNNRLWWATSQATPQIFYLQMKDRSYMPYANFPASTEASGPHELVSSRYEAGYRRVDKSSPELLVEASNLSSSAYLQIYYSMDGGTWKAWGGVDGTSNKVATSGVTKMSNPLGVSMTTLEYKYIQIKVRFITTDSTTSPVLEALVLKLIMRPDEGYGERFIIIAGDHLDHGGQMDDRRPDEIWDDIKEARASKKPVEYIDMWGDEQQVYITAINKQAVEVFPDKPGAKPIIEMRIAVNLVEVST